MVGTYVSGNGQERYEGRFENGTRSGRGKLRLQNSDVYEGGFRTGMMEGEGTICDVHILAKECITTQMEDSTREASGPDCATGKVRADISHNR